METVTTVKTGKTGKKGKTTDELATLIHPHFLIVSGKITQMPFRKLSEKHFS